MRGPGMSKHCVTHTAADEEAAIAAVVAAIFLVNRETALDLPNALAVLYRKKRRLTGYVDNVVPAYPICLQKELSPVLKYIWNANRDACLIFSQVETCLNPQRSSRYLPSWIFIHNILFILPLGAEWLEWYAIHSGIGMRNRKTRTFYILVILIPELWIKKRAISLKLRCHN